MARHGGLYQLKSERANSIGWEAFAIKKFELEKAEGWRFALGQNIVNMPDIGFLEGGYVSLRSNQLI